MTSLPPEKLLRRLEFRVLRRLEGRVQGDARTLFPGEGVDVKDLREYEVGDDARHIDWNVTARTDVPHVRTYLEDREVTAWLLLDRSPSMDFGPAGRRKHTVVLEIAATIAQVLARGGNRIGAVLFDADVEELIPPAAGRAQVLRILSRLLREPTSPTRRETALDVPLRAAAGIARRRSLIVVVSDFVSAPGWERPLGQLAQRHDVIALQIVDPREFELPAAGLVWIEDAETGEQMLVDSGDDGFRARLRALADERQAELTSSVRSAGCDLFTVSTDEDLVLALARMAARRRRRRR
jgi:uncharacterized protein (DUF58 family)